MNSFKTLFIAGLALATVAAASAKSAAQDWLEHYYQNPQPDRLGASVQALSREGYFEKPGHIALSIGFLSTVFAQNPEKIDQWLLEFNGLPLAHHRLIAVALWQAGHPIGAELLKTLGDYSPVREAIQSLANMPSGTVADTDVLTPASMNLQWGAFLATGEDCYVTNILAAIGQGNETLDQTARSSLTKNATAHPRLIAICQAQLTGQSVSARPALRSVLRAVANRKPYSTF